MMTRACEGPTSKCPLIGLSTLDTGSMSLTAAKPHFPACLVPLRPNSHSPQRFHFAFAHSSSAHAMMTRAAARRALEPPLPPVLLDARGYPHIINRIIELAPGPALLRFRGTSKELQARSDGALLRHIVFAADVVLRTPDGTALPRRRWRKFHKDQVRVVEFAHAPTDNDDGERDPEAQALSWDEIPAWVSSLDHVHTVLCPGTWHLSPPIPAFSTLVATGVPFGLPPEHKLSLRDGGRVVVLVREKRAEVELPDFIRDFGRADFTATFVFQEPEGRNRRPGDVLARMLLLLGRALADPDNKLCFTFVNTEAWAKDTAQQLGETMRTASGAGDEEFERRVRFRSLQEYAESVGPAQFQLEMGLGSRVEDRLY